MPPPALSCSGTPRLDWTPSGSTWSDGVFFRREACEYEFLSLRAAIDICRMSLLAPNLNIFDGFNPLPFFFNLSCGCPLQSWHLSPLHVTRILESFLDVWHDRTAPGHLYAPAPDIKSAICTKKSYFCLGKWYSKVTVFVLGTVILRTLQCTS